MNTLPRPKPLAVIVLDGWGVSAAKEGNAIAMANTPTLDMLAKYYPMAVISAAGLEVGLRAGQPGDSETGHKNIGAGKVQYQIMASIDKAIKDGSFFKKQALLEAIRHAQKNNSGIHLMGLISRGGVHSHIEHLEALLKLLRKKRAKNVFIHMFSDGRDSPPQSALGYAGSTQDLIEKYGIGNIASVTGRFWAMDRNCNWERTKAMYDMLTGGPRPPGAGSARAAIEEAYQDNLTDAKISPTAVTKGGAPLATIRENDAVIMFNFRPDRSRQLTAAFTNPDKVGFKAKKIKNIFFATLAQYDPKLSAKAAFDEEQAKYPLARIISEAGLKQLHLAETEKYAHVTYYLNVGREDPFPGEEWRLIKSSSVKNFARRPRMEAKKITDELLKEFTEGRYDVYFVNYANADMVGHTGDFRAAIKACEYVDECVGKLHKKINKINGALLITADHGNAEEMENEESGECITEHSVNPVPLHYVRSKVRRIIPKSDQEINELCSGPVGILTDVAPTILDILRLQKTPEMTGISLLGSLR